MDFGFSQEQELLRTTARKFLENECPSTFVRARMEEPAGVTDACNPGRETRRALTARTRSQRV